MNSKTELEHYLEEGNIGNYQWFSFSEVISELEIMASDSDSYISNTRRSQFINVTKQGIKLLQRNVRKDTKIIEFPVPKNLLFPYPQDYVNWVSLSVIFGNKLVPIFINKDINIAQRIELNNKPAINPFLHSESSLSLLQNEGLSNGAETQDQTSETEQAVFIHSSSSMSLMQDGNYFVYDKAGNIVRSTTNNPTNNDKYFKVESKYANQMLTQGQAVFNDLQGRISFGSDMEGMAVVLEYYSDGLFAWGMTDLEIQLRNLKPIRIHKDLKEVLIKYIYQEIIGYRRNVPANEKQRAKQEYKTYLHKAKLDRLGFNLYTVAKHIDSSSSPSSSSSSSANNSTTPIS
nr:hypothetical protein [uncultured Flavobacterium sp.]